jgi:hypothetical protein
VKTPVAFRLPEKSFNIRSLMSKIITNKRLDDGDGRVLENKEIKFSRREFIPPRLN